MSEDLAREIKPEVLAERAELRAAVHRHELLDDLVLCPTCTGAAREVVQPGGQVVGHVAVDRGYLRRELKHALGERDEARRGADAARLVALLPSRTWSIGTRGVPETNLVQLLGPRTPDLLRELQAAGIVGQLHTGGWVRP